MKTIQVEIQGVTPLLHHRMSEEDILGLLVKSKAGVKKEKVTLTPRDLAEKAAYRHKTGICFIPSGYITGAFIQSASNYKRTDSSKKSLKSVAGGAFRVTHAEPTLLKHDDSEIDDFEVDVRKGTNGLKGAVCVCRPRFDQWKVKFDAEINEDLISPDTAHQILIDAGRQVGIGSFRVAKSGWFGQFAVTSWKEMK